MRRHITRLLACGLIAGVCAGAVAAVAIPQTTPMPSASSQVAAPAIEPAAVGVERVAAARTIPRGQGYTGMRAVGPVRVSATVPDPRGGPPWAVRTYLAERLSAPEPDGSGGGRVIGRNRCIQVGRISDGRFGWLTSDGTFRPVTIAYVGAPTQCLSRQADMAGNPFGEIVTTITDPRRSVAEPVQTIVYALAGSAARDARLTVAGRSAPLARGAAGALLAVLPADTRGSEVALTVRYPRRGAVSVIPHRRQLPPRLAKRSHVPAPGAVTVLAAQAPDPDGGLPYAMSATRANDGGYCTSTGGRVIGDQAGGVNYALELVRLDTRKQAFGCPATRAKQRRARRPDGRTLPPFQFSASFGGGLGVELGEDPGVGRVARRSLPGRVIYAGTADPDVRSLTFATPSDVRTLVPSGPAHAFVIVYAGGFPTGDTTVTTTFDDGRTRRDVLPNFGF